MCTNVKSQKSYDNTSSCKSSRDKLNTKEKMAPHARQKVGAGCFDFVISKKRRGLYLSLAKDVIEEREI